MALTRGWAAVVLGCTTTLLPGGSGQRSAPAAEPPPERILFGTAFAELRQPSLTADRSLPEELRARIRRFQERSRVFETETPAPRGAPGPDLALAEKRWQFERGIVGLIDGDSVAKLAREASLQAPLAYEWEGMSDGPLAEAAYADAALADPTSARIAPYLRLFLAHRLRCGFEALVLEKNSEQAAVAEKRYAVAIEAALADSDPLVRFVARDLDRRPFVHLDAGRHPAPRAHEAPKPGVPSSRPQLPLVEALRLADLFARERKIDLSEQYIHSASLRYDETAQRRGFYWRIQWAWDRPKLGGEYGVRVYMDGAIVEAWLGP